MSLPKLLTESLSFTIEKNPHKVFYESAEGYLYPAESSEMVNPIDMLTSGTIWEATWYPSTPVGHCSRYAPTLEELFDSMNP